MKTLLFRETAVGLHQVKVQKNPIYLLPVANNDSTNTSNTEKNPYIYIYDVKSEISQVCSFQVRNGLIKSCRALRSCGEAGT